MDVIGGYSFAWERRLSWLLILGAAEVGCAVLMRMLRGNARFFRVKSFLFCLVSLTALCTALAVLLFAVQAPKPRKTMGWT